MQGRGKNKKVSKFEKKFKWVNLIPFMLSKSHQNLPRKPKKKKKKKKTKDKNKNKNKKKVGIMIIENKRRQKNFLRKKHLRELRKLRVKERIGEQKDQIGFQMKQQEEALALEPDSITLMTFLSLSLSL